MNEEEEIKRTFERLSKEEIKAMNEKTMEEAKSDFANFKAELGKGVCYYCKDAITSFDEEKPCFHWLLRPTGCDKTHIGKLLNQNDLGFFRIMAFSRWIANTEVIGANINNLRDEISSSKKIELTIKYKNYEWAFSCSPNDFKGHSQKKEGKMPHYHFSMKIDGKPFVRFGDFHAPFTDEDLFNFKAMDLGVMKSGEIYGASTQDIMDIVEPEKLLEMMVSTDDPQKSAYRLQTIVMAEQGKTISGDMIADIQKESRERRIPIARIVKERGLNAQVIISPGEGIPEMFKRQKR